MDIKDLQEVSRKFIDEREWRQFQTVKDLAMNASVEANELMEHFLWKDGSELDRLLKEGRDPVLLQKVKNETADVFFSCLAIADHLGFDLGEAFMSKMSELENRYKKDEVKGKVVKIPDKNQ